MRKLIISKNIEQCGIECSYYDDNRCDAYCNYHIKDRLIDEKGLYNKNFPSWCPLEEAGEGLE